MRPHHRVPRWTRWVVLIAVLALPACSAEGAATVRSAPVSDAEPAIGEPGGALAGPADLDQVAGPERERLLEAAEDLMDHRARATDPLDVAKTDGPFVVDAQAAWTLALAGRVSGDSRFSRRSASIVDDWASTAESATGTCADAGGCDTSLMVSRSAPAMAFAVDLLVGDGFYGPEARQGFHAWLREVILPAASNRENNWGDAGTFLIAVIGAELDDPALLERAAARWLERLDLMDADGAIPEEVRRGCASLLYSQDALDYKVATADVLARSGIDLWERRGARGGTLREALSLVADGFEHPERWPCDDKDDELRIPDRSGAWAIAAHRWPTENFVRQAELSASGDGTGHSAVIWTLVTHPVGD